MSDPLNSSELNNYITRWQSGDREAADELLRLTIDRLEQLAHRMTRSFPNVRGQSDTGDVLQNSLLRLFRTLQTLRPATTRDFFNLAAVHIRRELLDLARRRNSQPHDRLVAPEDSSDIDQVRYEPIDNQATDRVSDDFHLWARFHEAVDELPLEEREIVGLVFYHGWTQARIAELFGVDQRTIRRRWASACVHLREIIGTDLLGETS